MPPQPSSPAQGPGGFSRPAANQRPVTLACRNVWKVFGRGADDFMRGRDDASSEDLLDAGLIGAVRRASLDVYQGEIFIVMGLSGSGKSTLVRCLSRLIEPTAGEVMFEGRDLLKASERELIDLRRHKMGMVFQHFALLPHLTVLDNVAFPLAVQGVPKAQRSKRAHEVIELVGLQGRELNFPRQLSGGQQQRVGIARSLAGEPEIWFLDEPFSALDPLIRREMQDEFIRLQNVLHKTIVFITHDFDEAIRLADRIAIMKDGQIIQVGTPEELVVRPATDYVAVCFKNPPPPPAAPPGAGAPPAPPPPPPGGRGPPDARVAVFAAEIVGDTRPFAVVDGGGAVIGQIQRDDVIDILAGRSRAQ